MICALPAGKEFWRRGNADGAGLRLGYELLRQASGMPRMRGAKRISLSVIAAKTGAIRLYKRCGFQEIRRLSACVWET
jgi:ribosomal protein S18 acetylase RimI-like enzyme